MGTNIRAVLSPNNKYWIDKHRYYELKHFCLQYPQWRKFYKAIDGLIFPTATMDGTPRGKTVSDFTAKQAVAKAYYADKIDMVEKAAEQADKDLASYILKAVTEGLSYTHLKSKLEIPCGKDMYYDRYRKFFWILSELRG